MKRMRNKSLGTVRERERERELYFSKIKKEKGITLISLVITIIILLILAGIAIISLTGENGLLSRTKEAKLKENESTAKEKLQLVLMNANIDKESKTEYNKDEYLTNLLETEGMIVNEDVITVAGWNFKIDREKLEILESQGKSNINIAYEPKVYLGKNADGNYVMSILLTIESNVKMSNIVVTNPDGTISSSISNPDKLLIGIDKDIEFDKEYTVKVDTTDGKSVTRRIMEKSVEEIATVDGLVEFRDRVNSGLTYEGKTIKLTDNIDLSSVCGATIGNWEPIGNETTPFSGTFDGNHKIIENLNIDSTDDYQALFGKALNGTIKNITLDNVQVKGKEYVAALLAYGENVSIEGIWVKNNNSAVVASKNHCGGIAGKVVTGDITQSCNQANIAITIGEYYTFAGGIIGYMEGTNVSNCYNIANIETNGSMTNVGSNGVRAAGIAGHAIYNCKVEYSYNIGTITAKGLVSEPGGINGCTYSSIINSCFNVGNIINVGRELRGGNITAWTADATVSNCYYAANNMCGFNYSGNTFSNNKLETADNIKSIAINILGGDNNIWVKVDGENDNYPIFKWQSNIE